MKYLLISKLNATPFKHTPNSLFPVKTVTVYNRIKTDKHYLDNWHTEEWFHGAVEQFTLFSRKLINNVQDYVTSRI